MKIETVGDPIYQRPVQGGAHQETGNRNKD